MSGAAITMSQPTFMQQAADRTADQAAWDSTDEAGRQAYAEYLADEHGSSQPGAQQLGTAPPLSPREFFARRALEAAGEAPWTIAAKRALVERATRGPESLSSYVDKMRGAGQ